MDNSIKRQIFCLKINLKEQKSDFSYWQTQSYQARLKALEEIRHSYHQWKYKNAESRLQRVYTISQR
jgi:hypothetical protein